MSKIILHVSLFTMISLTGSSFGQTSFGSEEEALKLAHNLYISSQYAEAAPFYAQLLSNHPENSAYNYYYGVCMLFSSKNKTEALHHLEKAAATAETPVMVHYYLGKACQLCYEFDKAIESFGTFKTKSNAAYLKILKVDEHIAMCRNAMKQDFAIGEKNILSQSETEEDKFILKYNFANNNSKFLITPDRFIKGKSNKEKFSKYVFVSSSGKWLVFSGPGKAESDIYFSKRKSANDWDNPKILKFSNDPGIEKINPVISDDGLTIYFSSCSADGIGGYDVFSSTFDNKTKLWSSPVHLDFPVNSPDDDFYFVPAEEEGFAFVSSKRNCDNGKMNVLKIKLSEKIVPANNQETKPVNNKEEILYATNKKEIDQYSYQVPSELFNNPEKKPDYSLEQIIQKEEKRNAALTTNLKKEERSAEKNINAKEQNKIPPKMIKGIFYSLDKPSSMQAKITAINAADTNLVYRTQTNPKTGEYALTLPAEGEYKFIIEKEGYHIAGNSVSITAKNTEINQVMIINKNKNGQEYFFVMNREPGKTPTFSSEEKLTYKVQIGSYSLQTVEEVMNKLNMMGIKEVNFITLKSGMHVFFTGEMQDIFTALSKRKELIKKGITDAFVAVFSGENQISMDEVLHPMK